MKMILTSILVSVILFANAQSESKIVTFQKAKIGRIDCEYKGIIKAPNFDTSKYISLSFDRTINPNMKADVSLYANDNEDSTAIYKFINTMSKAIPQIGANADVIFKEKEYSIYLLSGNKKLSLGDNAKSESYTSLSAKEAENLVSWIVSLGFKDFLATPH